MLRRVIECVPNFSEGRDARIVDKILDAIARGPGIAVLGKTMDADHNRSVITFAGQPEAVAAAALRGVAKAVECIDLNRHSGVHPRLGAADVIPFVPVRGVSLAECAGIAREAGAEIWRALGVPVYFYEAAARMPGRDRLENVRRGGFEAIREASPRDQSRQPDIGGPELHPTAGACIVGARKFLIAVNVNLATTELAVAKDIARAIRESSGGMRYVKALGLPLRSRNQAQVSMNLTDFEQTPLHVVVESVRREAGKRNVAIAGTEIIGLLPKGSIERAAEFYLQFENFSPDLVLENRLSDLLPASIEDVLDEIADPGQSPGGGSAAALAGSLAAALAVLTCRLTGGDEQRFAGYRAFFSTAARRDAEAFALLLRENQPAAGAIVRAAETPLQIAEKAACMHAELRELAAGCPPRFLSDAITAVGLSDSARLGAAATARLNIQRIEDGETRKALENRLQKVE